MFKKIKELIPKIFTIKQIPNFLTTARGVAGPALPVIFFCVSPIAALITFGAAALTDLFDGALARYFDAETTYGKKVDPVADKVLGIFGLATSFILNPFMAVPIVLETAISGVNVANYFKTKKFESSKIGKIKTVVLFSTICLSFLPGIDPIIMSALLAGSTTLQVMALEGYVNKMKNSKNINNTEAASIEDPEEIEVDDESEEMTLEPKLQKKSLLGRYYDLKRVAQNIVTEKEEWERNLGKKTFSKRLEK